MTHPGFEIEVERKRRAEGFQVLPRRRIIEHTFW